MLKRAVKIGFISGLATIALGSLSAAIANPPPALTQNAEISTNSLVAQNGPVAIKSGTFVAAEQPTAGTAQIVTDENGQRYLELDSSFSTSDQGPDLHVLLDLSETPPQQYDESQSGQYVNLGALQEFSGSQRYPIPDVVDPTAFNSVVIWCRMANATFGYAALDASPVGLK